MWKIYDQTLKSRLLLGSAGYPSPESLVSSIKSSGSEVVTVSLRRQNGAESNFWDYLRACHVTVLPNTAGCRTAREAVTIARMARELFGTSWVKLEVIGDEMSLAPDPFGLVEAAQILNHEGFQVLPYMSTDLVLAEKLVEAGCRVLMPWASPIGSGRGIRDPYPLQLLRSRFPNHTLIVDAGIGRPSDAAQAMELGYDGVLLNTAVSQAADPVKMARAFASAIAAGREGYEAGIMAPRESAVASTPMVGTPFWHEA